MSSRIEAGMQAEQQACQFLEVNGLALRQRNYRCAFGEIDLVMQNASHVVFVEVRSRSRRDYGSALDSITRGKKIRLRKTAIFYLREQKLLYRTNSRFDIITIHYDQYRPQLEWFKNAFLIEE